MATHCNPPDRFITTSWHDARRAFYAGDMTQAEWEAYNCAWHRMMFRYSWSYVAPCQHCGAPAVQGDA